MKTQKEKAHRRDVAVYINAEAMYPALPPYHPPVFYPEFRRWFSGHETDASNNVFPSIRELFCLMKYDANNFASARWNPLGWLIRKGDVVFLKPNMISQKHHDNDDWDYVITHGSLIRAVIDYVFLALQGTGRVIVGDSPQTDSQFSAIVALMGLREIQSWYRRFQDFEIEIVNLQDEHWIEKDGVYTDTVRLAGDPRGKVYVDLGKDSFFGELDGMGKQFYGAFYDVQETNYHHGDGKHEYAISRSPLVADVFINLPKLKTHKKCGLTVNLKSLVGINANKNWLPHYVFGSPETGGDQFEKTTVKSKLENAFVVKAKRMLLKRTPLAQFIARKLKKTAYRMFGGTDEVIRSGNWHGNDTTWRMALDLNKILLYANADGTMRNTGRPKRFYSVVDGIISMEGNGPVAGKKKMTGVVIAGDNPVSVDSVCCKIMGFDYRKIPLVRRAFDRYRYPLASRKHDDIIVASNKPEWHRRLTEIKKSDSLTFKPHFGWTGTIELNENGLQ